MTNPGQPVYGPTNPAPPSSRVVSVIGLNEDKEQYYRELHADVWAGVLLRLRESNIQNYSIHIAELDGKKYLFSCFEYAGNNFAADQQAIAADAVTQKWWIETDPCQIPLPGRQPDAHWSELEQLFFMP